MTEFITSAQMQATLRGTANECYKEDKLFMMGAREQLDASPPESPEFEVVNVNAIEAWTEFVELTRQRLNEIVQLHIEQNAEQNALMELVEAASSVRVKASYSGIQIAACVEVKHNETPKGHFSVTHNYHTVLSGAGIYEAIAELNRRNGFEEESAPRSLVSLPKWEPAAQHAIVEQVEPDDKIPF